MIGLVQFPARAESYETAEWLTSEKSGVGAKWKETPRVFGNSYSQTIEVVEWREPTSLALTATEHGAIYLTRYSLEESQDGETTEVEASFEVKPNNLFSKVFVKLMGNKLLGSTCESLKSDLSDLDNAEEGS